ncbi:MAG TPA: hypothetical protein PLD20_25615 [Blastocatellia bacterium]|nr:hypothetical protein [Blastocatellia bacterium]HMZ21336.1 hypothetical protein [Blastocatellia bacterium]HNG34540.1 hypothetical protein [Blastocatellia bacterium]
MNDLMQKIDSAKHLYLRTIHEPEDNVLLLIVQEAGAGGEAEDIQVAEVKIPNTRAIISSEKDLAYQILFPNYISYSVTNEAFALADEKEVRSGRLFSIYSQSHFLDFVLASTLATADYPGLFTHYQINCLNHVIDVVSVSEPEIKILESFLPADQV